MIILDILNFFAFLAGVVMFVNNIFYLNSNFFVVIDIEDNINLSGMVFATLTAFIVMFVSMSSPYETDETFTIYNKLWLLVVYIVSLAYTATSLIIDDPELLVEATFDIVSVDNTFINFELDENDVISFGGMSDITRTYITLFNISKVFCLGYGLFNTIYIFMAVDIFKRSFLKKVISTLYERLVYTAMLVIDVIVVFTSFSYEQGKNSVEFNQHIDSFMQFTDSDDIINTFYTSQFDIAIQYFSMLTLIVCAGLLIILFDTEYQFSIVPTLLLTVQSIIRIDSSHQDNAFFTICVILGMVQAAFLVALVIKQFQSGLKTQKLDAVIVPLVNSLYKAGNILSLVSLLFLYIGYMYPWVNTTFEPLPSLNLGVLDDVRAAKDTIDGILDDVFSVVKVLDPCYRRKSVARLSFSESDVAGNSEFDTNLQDSSSAQDSELQNQLKEVCDSGAKSGDCLYCTANPVFFRPVSSVDPSIQGLCQSFEDRYEKRRKEILSTFDKQSNENDKEYTEGDSNDDDNDFVDPRCRDVQCNVLLTAGIAAMAIANIPFFGGTAMLMKIASKAVHTIFKVGRKIAKVLPRLRKVRKRIKKLNKTVQSLLISTVKAMSATPALSIIFLPVLLGAFISIVLLVVRRRIYVDPTASYTEQSIQKAIGGIKFIFAVWSPVVVSEGFFLIALTYYKDILNGITGAIPDGLIKAEVTFLPGYEALRISYMVGFVGHLLIFASAITYVVANTSVAVLDKFFGFFIWLGSLFARFIGLRRREKGYKKVDTGAEVKETWQKSLRTALTKWNNIWFWPFIFSLPVFILYFVSFDSSFKYIKYEYSANHNLLSKGQDLNEVLAGGERSETIGVDTQDEGCGLVGQVVNAVLKEVKSLSVISSALLGFTAVISSAFKGAKDFLKELQPLLDLPSIDIPYELFAGLGTENNIIFLLPLLNTLLIGAAYVATMFADKFDQTSTFAKLVIKTYDEKDVDDPNASTISSSLSLAVPFGIFYLSIVNIMLHEIITSLIMFLNDQEMPFIKVKIEVSTKYYFAVLASLFNILSVVAFYVNTVFPPEDVVKKQVQDRIRMKNLLENSD